VYVFVYICVYICMCVYICLCLYLLYVYITKQIKNVSDKKKGESATDSFF